MLAEQNNRADREEIQQRNAEGMVQLGGVLRTTTVDPDQTIGGSVLFALPKKWRKNGVYPVTFEITTGEETHLIKAKLTRR